MNNQFKRKLHCYDYQRSTYLRIVEFQEQRDETLNDAHVDEENCDLGYGNTVTAVSFRSKNPFDACVRERGRPSGIWVLIIL